LKQDSVLMGLRVISLDYRGSCGFICGIKNEHEISGRMIHEREDNKPGDIVWRICRVLIKIYNLQREEFLAWPLKNKG
jgi:hypothetical protein